MVVNANYVVMVNLPLMSRGYTKLPFLTVVKKNRRCDCSAPDKNFVSYDIVKAQKLNRKTTSYHASHGSSRG